MERICRLAIWAVLAVGLAGCGKQGAEGQSASTANESAVALKATTPAEAVFSFLEAVRRGDDAAAGSMLTDLARKKTAEMDMVVAPPGSDTASFEVGEVAMASQDRAHVASTWTDVDHDGKQRTDQITWILRHESEGWRIAGMAAQIFPDQDPIMLNFEDPQDMVQKQRMAEEERPAGRAPKKSRPENRKIRSNQAENSIRTPAARPWFSPPGVQALYAHNPGRDTPYWEISPAHDL